MESHRLPHFKRSTAIAPLQLTQRDRSIIRLVHQHRFLRSTHIIALLGGSSQPLLRRLQLLYHHGYLERPRAQLEYFHVGGSKPIVYGLGNKGGTLLRKELGSAFRNVSWGEKNRAVGRIFLAHALLVSEIMVALELACRHTPGVRLLSSAELHPGDEPRLFAWQVKVNQRVKLGLVPDRVFGVEYPGRDGTPTRAYFFLEADRGTMPVKRRHLVQTSFKRKLLAYAATWHQGIHKTEFDFHRFRVVTVTKSAARVRSLVDACAELEYGHGLFLFADESILADSRNLFSAFWQTGRPGETTTLLS